MTPPEGRGGVRLKAVSVTPYGPSQSGRGQPHSKTLREDPEQVLECPLPLLSLLLPDNFNRTRRGDAD